MANPSTPKRKKRPVETLPAIRWALLFAAAAYAVVGTVVFDAAPQNVAPAFVWSLYTVSVSIAFAAFVLARRIASPQIPNSQAAGMAIVVWALAESVAIMGLVVKALGATQLQAAPLYVLGIVLLVWWTPNRLLPSQRHDRHTDANG